MKVISKIINFDQPDIEGNFFTEDSIFHFPDGIEIIKKTDGLYIEYEIDIKDYEKLINKE